MFTGLIREIGILRRLSRQRTLTRLVLEAPATAPDLALGDSLAVNGICLTVVGCDGGLITVEAVAETRAVTTLDRWRPGRLLHLEPALRAGDRLGGHLVLGHVDGVGTVRAVRRQGAGLVVRITAPAALIPWLQAKGSIAVDGVSLTLDAGPFGDGFTLNLIPHTLSETLFGRLKPGHVVNLEADVQAKSAASHAWQAADDSAAQLPRPLTIETILNRGFGRGRSRR